VSLATDQNGMIVDRTEAASGGSPRTLRYVFGGLQMGEVGNDGTSNTSFAASVADRLAVQPTPTAAGPFHNGGTSGTPFADFDQSYDAINSSLDPGTGSTYLASAGDTLQSIAAMVWGDASLWYLLADANGMSGAEQLQAGRSLTIPEVVANVHNNSQTFRPYDAARAIGDVNPTTPKPVKNHHGCGVVGAIILVAVAVAVTALTAGAAILALAPASAGITTIGAGLSAIAAGATGLSAGALIGIGAAAGALGSIASQGLGVATGLQSKFNWSGVALSALAGAVTAGIGPGGLLGKAGAFAGFGGTFGSAALRGSLSSTVSQGIGLAAGLQTKFDWVGVAGAGIGAGVSASVGVGGLGGRFVSGMAGGIADSAARTLLNGSDFGDNLLAALPEVIGNVLGNMFVDGVAPARETTMQRLRREGGIELAYQDTPNADSLRDYPDVPIVVTGIRPKPEHGWGWRLADSLGLHDGGFLYNAFHGRLTFDTSGVARTVAMNILTTPVKAAQFGAGTVYGLYQVGRGAVVGTYHLVTTDPRVTAHNLIFGAASLVDGALQAENTPASVQIARASRALSNASAFDVGTGFGKVGGNLALVFAPAAAAGRAGAVSELGSAGRAERLAATAEASVPSRAGAVNPLEVGSYRDLASRSIGDGLTPDHIPSFAAVRKSVENDIGRPLTPSEARQLRNETNTLVIDTDLHQQVSATYGGRNTPAQIEADAQDLGGAAMRDQRALQQALIERGYSPQQVLRAFEKLHAANRARGLYR
jgi:hypothetical protein